MSSPLLHYQRWGQSHQQSVVLLHGFLGNTLDWQPIINYLKEHVDILAIDLPGHGQSNHIGLNFSFDETAASIKNILHHENIVTCSLAGYSMGGRLALFTALKYPHLFPKLILESCSPGIQSTEERRARLQFERTIIEKLENQSMDIFIRDWYSMSLFDSIRSHRSFQDLVSRRIQNDPMAMINSIKKLGNGAMPSLWKNLATLDVPIHFIYGEKDKKYKSIAAGMLEHNKNVSLYEIKNSGHNTHFENPIEFCTVVNNILTNEE